MAPPQPILVVDDDTDVREALGEVLAEEGYATRLFESGREALAFLRGGGAPALILLDLMMPEMNGWQFREEQLKDERLREIPVVVITASRLDGGALKAREVLFKPIGLGELVDAVHRNASAPRPNGQVAPS
ncbi:MAG TPA: response regulator [Anaeromyxobacter sp.]|nr:response regulator [Anaeromyxobacter sp.]